MFEVIRPKIMDFAFFRADFSTVSEILKKLMLY